MVKFSVLTKILPLCVFLSACTGEKKESPPGEVPPLTIHRFERDLFSIDTTHFVPELSELARKYPDFASTHFQNVWGVNTQDSSSLTQVKSLLANRFIEKVSQAIDSVYPSLETVEADLASAFARFEQDFPGIERPQVVTFPASLSAFRPAVWNSDSVLAIGIDCFLGADYYFYQTTSFPRYITRRFTPAHLLPTTLRGYIQYHFPPSEDPQTFLASMVYDGKVLYLLDRLLPGTADSLKIGFTGEQMAWAATYERDIWAYFIEQEVLYSTIARDYSRYLDEAPFTTDLGPHSAPRVGAFTGWQIVRKYMAENDDVTPLELMHEIDSQKILNLSGYKPR